MNTLFPTVCHIVEVQGCLADCRLDPVLGNLDVKQRATPMTRLDASHFRQNF